VTETAPRAARTGSDEPPLAISVRDLHVSYRVYEDAARPGSTRLRVRSRAPTTVHALKGISLDIREGEAVGFVGSNGSGKSTLLRSIAGLESKDSGMVLVRGEASLLGVGASLKKELSGYRNVILGGLAMGLSRAEIHDLMPHVVKFSGLGGDAMSRPMRTYSSGMKARLAFSIATLRTPDILLIDEALAVGDRRFKRRSLNRINDIKENSGTVVMVTHNTNEIRRTCTRAIWLEDGSINLDGSVEEVLEAYDDNAP
jgi:teichoic acid transport system ATP-binding protein